MYLLRAITLLCVTRLVYGEGWWSERYLGCYVDEVSNNRVLKGSMRQRWNQNSPRECINWCRKVGAGRQATFAGLEFSHQCFCGNESMHGDRRPDSECSSTCPGDPDEKCGGTRRIGIYSICPRGFFVDKNVSSQNCYGRCLCKDRQICAYWDGRCPNGECEPGWVGYSCQDIDECGDESSCDHNCTNTQGGYHCTCKPGFKLGQDLKLCKADACWTKFERQIDETSGVSSTCASMTVLVKTTLEECTKEACRIGANVINKRLNVCEIQKCPDTTNIKYTASRGGWAIYALPRDTPDTSRSKGVNLAVIIPAILVPLVLVVMVAAIVGVLVKKRRAASTGETGQRAHHKNTARAVTSIEYENTGFDGRKSGTGDEGHYDEIIEGLERHEHYLGLDRQTRQETVAQYDAMQ